MILLHVCRRSCSRSRCFTPAGQISPRRIGKPSSSPGWLRAFPLVSLTECCYCLSTKTECSCECPSTQADWIVDCVYVIDHHAGVGSPEGLSAQLQMLRGSLERWQPERAGIVPTPAEYCHRSNEGWWLAAHTTTHHAFCNALFADIGCAPMLPRQA